MEQDYKRIPYGRCDFVQIIEQNNYYVDKTMYLPSLEDEAVNLIFIRPRRFGKSIFLSMLHAYYDCRTKDKFQKWFGNLWIGKHPTPLQGRYQVLHLDFSQVGGDIEHLRENFNFYLGVQLDGFVRYYDESYSDLIKQNVYAAKDAGGKLAIIQNEAKAKGKIRQDCDVDAVVNEMKPWYDNYCFSKSAFHTQSKVFNCDMVFYYLRNYMSTGEAPDEMVDPNTKTDYNKMKKLLLLDKLDGDRKGLIRTITEKGEIIASLYETFPANKITDPEYFPSLLFYYGMLTIKGVLGNQLILGIPNNNVRKQYYEYLLEEYKPYASINLNELGTPSIISKTKSLR